MKFENKLSITLAKWLYNYFSIVDKLFGLSIRIRGGPQGLKISLETSEKQSVDQRLAKIDEARNNLRDGLSAIDELREAAEQNKKDLEEALSHIEIIKQERESMQGEISDLRRIAAIDIGAFQKMANIPTKNERMAQQIVGFISGIIASLAAAGIWWAVSAISW